MTSLLLKIFVPNHRQPQLPAVRSAVGSLSGAVGICCNLLLFVFKLVIGTLSGSVSITADAMNNLSDASGSIVTLLGFRLADKPADEHHPFGHARAEYLSGLAVAVLVLFIGYELAKSSLEKILRPEPVALTAVMAAVLLVSVAVKLWMYLFNRKLGKLIGSSALLATAADSRNDVIATGAVLLSAIIAAVDLIKDTEKGPYIEAHFLDTAQAQDVRKMLQSGAIYQFSFAYDVLNSRKPTEDESAKGITNVPIL